MDAWTFFGIVEPFRSYVTFELDNKTIFYPEINLKLCLSIKISNSKIICHCYLLEGSIEIFSLRNLIKEALNDNLDFICYLNGVSFDIDIHSAYSTNEEWQFFPEKFRSYMKENPIIVKK